MREELFASLGISKARLSREAGVDPQTVTDVLAGKGKTLAKVRAVDHALARLAAAEEADSVKVEEAGQERTELHVEEPHAVEGDDGLIEFEIGGNFGVSVVVRGPVANWEEVEKSARRFVQAVNQKDQSDGTPASEE